MLRDRLNPRQTHRVVKTDTQDDIERIELVQAIYGTRFAQFPYRPNRCQHKEKGRGRIDDQRASIFGLGGFGVSFGYRLPRRAFTD